MEDAIPLNGIGANTAKFVNRQRRHQRKSRPRSKPPMASARFFFASLMQRTRRR
jgi:hypothetical protein